MSSDLQRRWPTASPWRHAALATALSLSMPALAHAQPTGSPGASDRADTLYRQGNEAFKKGDLEAARTAYREAFALRQSFDIAANLGAVELQLGAYRDAAEHLAASVRVAPVNGSADAKAKTAGMLRDAKAKVATLVVTTSEPDAEVQIDGKSIGRSPFANEVFVEPGRRVFTATRGNKTAKLEVDLVAGSSRDVALELREGATPPAPTPPGGTTTNPPGEVHEGPPLWPGFVIGGVGVVGVGVGIGLLAAGGSASTDADDAAAGLRESGATCPAEGGGPAECATIASSLSDSDGLRTGGAIAITAGSAVLVGGVVYLVWAATQGASDERSGSSSIRPWAAPGLVGTGLQGAF